MSTAKTITAPGTYWTQDIAVAQWDKHLCRTPGRYFVIPMNSELTRMISGEPFSHFNCIVDDFGNLVRCAA